MTRSFLAGTLLVLALFAAGCGGGSSPGSGDNGEAAKPAQQVLDDATKAAEAASSFHMSGQIGALGQQIGIDMTIVKGSGATGSVTLAGQKVDLVIIGKDTYLKAGNAFWTQFGGPAGSTVAQMLQGKWVKVPTTGAQFAQITDLTDSKSLFDSLASVTGKPTNEGAATYNGQSVVKIDADGKLYVAASGTPYPVAAVAPGSGVSGAIAFDRWNASVTLAAPSGAIDFSGLSGQTSSPNDGSGDGATISIATGTPTAGDSTSPSALQGAGDVAKLFKGIPQNGLVLGQPDAPVTLIEYIDLQCPLCQVFETTELAPLVEKYVRPGKLEIEMQPWAILDRSPDEHDSERGQKATIGAAAQNKAFNFAEVLYLNQGTEDTGWLNDAMVSNIAASVDGLDPYRLATDANSARTQSVIDSITNFANAHPGQMTGTPTIYLATGNGRPQWFQTGVPDLASLEAAIDARLK